jgi:hypothetical protein
MLTFNLSTPAAEAPALYVAVPDTADGNNSLYYLAATAGATSLSLPNIWKLRGAFVIAPTASDLAGFPAATLQQLAKSLNVLNPGQGPAAIAWLTGPAASYGVASITLLNANPNGTAIVGVRATIAIGPASLQIPAQTVVQIGTAANAMLTLTAATSSSLSVYIAQAQPLTANSTILAFDGPTIGAVSLPITNTDPSLYQIFAFCNPQLAGNQTVANGPDLRYYLAPAQHGGAVTELRFPVFAPASATASNPPDFTLQMQLDPLWPFDAGRTVMTPDLTVSGVPALFSLPLFTTVAGLPVTMTPTAVSLYFAQNNSGGYVAPAGSFTVAVPASPAPLLCGLLGQEHFKVNTGDTITLLPASAGAGGFPALVIGSAAVQADDAIVTSIPSIPGAVFTTSWLQYAPAASKSGAYFAQPQPAVSFSSGSLQTSVAAVAAQLASRTSAFAPIPMACHAAAYPPPVYSGSGSPPPGWPVGGTQFPTDVTATWPNSTVPAPSFGDVEHLGLAPMRYRTLFGDQSRSAAQNPIFEVQGSRGAGATATTQQGFVVQLNPLPNAIAPVPPTGSWNSVVLAVYEDETTVLAPPPPTQVLDAQLVTTLLSNQLFMVVDQVPIAPASSPADPVTAAVSSMEVGGFAFKFDADQGGQQILLFKFNDALSLNDLINQTAHWNTSYLHSDPGAVQTILQNAVAVAKNAPAATAALFADFVNRILVEPSWTGVIAFNCAIDATKMPPSLEILIAAAVGQTITAHHFGIEISQVTQQGQQVGIKQSSLFGVIAYDGSPPKPVTPPLDFSFWTETLHVLIHNSSVTQFQAAIQVALNTPFGRAATCAGAANAIKLAGAYQQQGELGTVTFSEADPGSAVYSFTPGAGLRVLDQMAVRTATLLPGAATNHGETIPGQIVMGGTLMFDPDPFGQGIDLFGYGTGTGAGASGLDFTGFTLNVTATIGADGGQTTAAVDYSAIKVSAGKAALRANSLVNGLPCQVDAFLSDTANGLTADSLQAQSVHVLELENINVPAPTNPLPPPNSPSASVDDAPATIQVSYTTPSPFFAVTFDLPLGSLGSLADAHASLDTSLILGWGPSPTAPDDDGAAVLIKLPFASVGYGGFNLQGVLKTVFGDANLMQVSSVPAKPYVILFNNVQLSVFGIKLPPHVLSDLIVFIPAGQPGPMGMCLLAKET